MFPSLAARETCVAEAKFAVRKTKNVFAWSQNIFASRTQILRPKHLFPSLATPGNITRNIVSLFLAFNKAEQMPIMNPLLDRIPEKPYFSYFVKREVLSPDLLRIVLALFK